MRRPYRILGANHYLSTQIGLIKEWQAKDAVAFSQLVDFHAIERERARRGREGLTRPSYTAFVVDSIARALRDHPKLNRMVFRGLFRHRWAEFENIDVSVAVEAIDEGVDISYGSIIRHADRLGVEGIMDALRRMSGSPFDDPQIQRLKRFPAAIAAMLARATRLHPKTWVEFRGGSCALTSPAKYGIESVIAKSPWPLQFALGNVSERPMVLNGQCVPRFSAMISMSWHRELTTGAVAARFFEQVVQQLQSFRGAAEERAPEPYKVSSASSGGPS